MRVLLAQNSLYYPAHGGGDKSNRLLVEALAERGHRCRVIARIDNLGEAEHQAYLSDLAMRQVPVASSRDGVVAFDLAGVEVRVVANTNLRAYFARQIAEFAPDVILVSTDDPAQLMLEAALESEQARVVFLARTTLPLPFGPECAFESAAKTELLRKVDAAIGVSQYVSDYIRRWSGIPSIHLPISLMGAGPYRNLGRFENEFVTFVNPCAVKGISIFLALAEQMPDVQFAAVPTWGTNAEDRAALARIPNVRILKPVDNIDDLLCRTRVLLVPSIWAEARCRIVVEAMLRGVPVIASNVGGIPEAMMGVDYLLAVNPITHYRPQVDENMVPVAEVPPQDVTPWREALRRLVTERKHWEELAAKSRETALAYARNLNVGPLERYLEELVQAPRKPRTTNIEQPAPAPAASRLERLSPERLALLAMKLRKKADSANTSGNAWFPSLNAASEPQLRLFCFPYAGAGTFAFRSWAEKLAPEIAVVPARLPGRESRAAEPPIDRMEPLIAALAKAIEPHLGKPFAFYGHSMGAAIAFELARKLRREGKPLPCVLLVSGARAPQFRLGWNPPPEPSEADFLDDLRRLEGLPPEVLQNRELLGVLMPALRADAALYRRYIYIPEPPLDCPIRVYGGEDDPNIPREHFEAWKEQTTSSFALRMFAGGHFFIHTSPDFLNALSADLAPAASQAK